MNILFVTVRFPYPPLKGDQVIVYNRIRCLAKEHEITLVSFCSRTDRRYLNCVQHYCRRIVCVPVNKLRLFWNLVLNSMRFRLPFQVAMFTDSRMKLVIRRLVSKQRFDIANLFLIRAAEYLHVVRFPSLLDLVDSMTLNLERRASSERSLFMRTVSLFELSRMREYEQMVAKHNHVVFVSVADAHGAGAPEAHIIPIGVRTDIFSPKDAQRDCNVVVFTGNLGYFSNVEAVLWFAENCLPILRQLCPNVRFRIIGARPVRKVLALRRRDGIEVTGFVDDLVAELQRASVAVAPMQSGSGMQFKIIESMACGLPVIATSLAKESLEADEGEGIIVTDRAQYMAPAIAKLLQDRALAKEIGAHGRALVCRLYSWDSHMIKLKRMYGDVLAVKEDLFSSR